MDPEDLTLYFYYGYTEPPYGYMRIKYMGVKKEMWGTRYVFAVGGNYDTEIELTEQQVRDMVQPQ